MPSRALTPARGGPPERLSSRFACNPESLFPHVAGHPERCPPRVAVLRNALVSRVACHRQSLCLPARGGPPECLAPRVSRVIAHAVSPRAWRVIQSADPARGSPPECLSLAFRLSMRAPTPRVAVLRNACPSRFACHRTRLCLLARGVSSRAPGHLCPKSRMLSAKDLLSDSLVRGGLVSRVMRVCGGDPSRSLRESECHKGWALWMTRHARGLSALDDTPRARATRSG